MHISSKDRCEQMFAVVVSFYLDWLLREKKCYLSKVSKMFSVELLPKKMYQSKYDFFEKIK